MLRKGLLFMQTANYTFDSLFLDSKYSDVFLELCKKSGIIHHDVLGHKTTISGHALNGSKKLLRALVLFEKIDFESSIYDYSELIDKGIISEDSMCCSNTNPQNEYELAAVSIMSAYKRGIIKYVREDFKSMLRTLQNPRKTPSYKFWQEISYSRELVDSIFITNGFLASLDKDYYELISHLDLLYNSSRGQEGFMHTLIIDQISTLLGIRNNIAYSLMAAEKNNSLFFSDFLNRSAKQSITNPGENIYSFVKTRLPSEVNILPMPQTLDDVWRMRNHSSVVSFRKVMREWNRCINDNDITAANRIKKDIIKANKAMEKLGMVKRCIDSPYIRTGYFIGGFVPFISSLVNVVSFIVPVITDALIEKYSWTHIGDR